VKEWSNLAKIVMMRTYSRNDNGTQESWSNIIDRVIEGNVRNHNVDEKEINQLKFLANNRKATPAGRGLWFSGAPSHDKIGGSALTNCWFFTLDDWQNYIYAQDLLMLGGGVGASVEHRFVSKLPKVKRDVVILSRNTKDADFIVPDSREGWNKLLEKVLESFFVTGKNFSYSTVCVRGKGVPIKGFGGTSSGPLPLQEMVNKLCGILKSREGRHIRPLDAADILCCIGEMVVAGNVRRSAILILGDSWDKEYLRAKRWDLGLVPSERAMANFSVVCDDIDDLHPSFWKTYENGEPFGIVNRVNIEKFGRMGERKKDYAIGVNPCAEATLTNGEPCNLQEIYLPNVDNKKEFVEAAVLMHRYGKRVTCEKYHNDINDQAVKKYRRVGTGITGCLQSNLFTPETLDEVYKEIQKENISYSKELGIEKSIRTTVVKPSGTLSLIGDVTAGIHPAYSRFYIRRVRFSSDDKLIPVLRKAGHVIEPVIRLDGTLDHSTVVVDFYCKAPEGTPVADEDWDMYKQLDVLKMVQKYWADQAASVTVYYKKEELEELKSWLRLNLRYLKTISFLCHNDHGFKQAPLEAITEKQYNGGVKKVSEISFDNIVSGEEVELDECEGGVCPIK
jgi:ribonucleoside-triphosphate reductase